MLGVFDFIVIVSVGGMITGVVSEIIKSRVRIAEIRAQATASAQNAQFETLRQEISDLKEIVHQQAIAYDSMSNVRARTREEELSKQVSQF